MFRPEDEDIPVGSSDQEAQIIQDVSDSIAEAEQNSGNSGSDNKDS